MDIRTFQTFLAAAATGSFSGAAERINASPSSVTERIKQLEYRLGTRLFVRDRRGCELTPAGRKFVAAARRAVRAWEFARHEVALPEHFTQSLSFGGQYFLWESLLMDWLSDIRVAKPDLALRAAAGSWSRLNRDIAEGTIDMIVVHDPTFRRDLSAERLFEDRLVLVAAGGTENWQDRFVRIEWGQSFGTEIASRLNIAPQAGIVLDLGRHSIRWLIDNEMAGYLPTRIAAPAIERGALKVVKDTPTFDFPAYACWRRDLDARLAAEIVLSLKARVSRDQIAGIEV